MDSLIQQRVALSGDREIAVTTGKNDRNSMLLLIHGAGGRSGQWINQVRAFGNQHFVVAPDLLGHGASSQPESGYSFLELAEDLNQLFYQFKCQQNFVVGHSYGCALALKLALENPGQIDKVVLIGAAPIWQAKISKMWKLPVPVLNLIRPILSSGFAKGAFHPDTDPEFIKQERAISDQNSMAMMKALFQGMEIDVGDELSKIDLPVLVINGEADQLTPVVGGKAIAEALPQAEFILVDKASHLVMMEQHEEVNRMIDYFLTGNRG